MISETLLYLSIKLERGQKFVFQIHSPFIHQISSGQTVLRADMAIFPKVVSTLHSTQNVSLPVFFQYLASEGERALFALDVKHPSSGKGKASWSPLCVTAQSRKDCLPVTVVV